MVHWGMMPRMMRQDGTHAGLTERYMRMFVAGLLANVGINTSRGTTLVVETERQPSGRTWSKSCWTCLTAR